MGMSRWTAGVCALALLGMTAGCAPTQMAAPEESVQLSPSTFAKVREIDERFQSYNVEIAEVIGGRFWKPYREMTGPTQPQARSQENTGGAVALDPALFSQRPEADLTDARLRMLARALGPAYIRVSGSWANTMYFQNDDNAPLATPPEGYTGVLTRAHWRGVVDFARAVDAKLVISYAINAPVRDRNGVWTPVQARPFMEYNRSIGGEIYAAELFNEPNLAQHAGGPPDYTGAAFVRDIAAFRAFAAEVAPDMKIVGPGDSPGLNPPEDFLSSEPRPHFDVFDYHFYPAVSQRCSPPDGQMGISPERAMGSRYLGMTDRALAEHLPLRDRYAPGAPIWITETAGAACGGAPWSATFLDTFRYLDQAGRLAKGGVDAIFHNTLSASEYGLIDDVTNEPRPNYWAALLWRRLMGTTVLNAGDNREGFHLYAHCQRDRAGGVTLLAVNYGEEGVNLATSTSAEVYALTAAELQTTEVNLNGSPLRLAGEQLPELRPRRVLNGQVSVAPHSVAFVALPNAGNSSCQ